MISRIGFDNRYYTNFQGSSNLLEKFKNPEQENQSNQAQNVTLNGNEALANYNKSSIENSQQKTETSASKETATIEAKPTDSQTITKIPEEFILKDIPKPLTVKGDEIETLSGERILNSDEKLAAIVIKGENTTKEYHFNNENKKITDIVERDNKTGFPIREDGFSMINNTNVSTVTREFSPENGQFLKETYFSDGQAYETTKFDSKNNIEIKNLFDLKGKINSIEIKDIKTDIVKSYRLDEKGEIVYTNERDGNYNDLKWENFKNGKVSSTELYEYKPIKNTFGIDPDNLPIKPADFVEKPDISKIEGEKKLRSDGSLEKIVVTDGNKKTTYEMDLAGKNLLSIVEKENDKKIKTVGFSDQGLIFIDDYKEGNINIRTCYNSDKKIIESIEYTPGNEENVIKSVSYSQDGSQLLSYYEGANQEKDGFNLEFDKDRNIIKAKIGNKNVHITKSEN